MAAGRFKHARGIIYYQALLVWGLKEIRPDLWIDRGELVGRGLEIPPDLQAKVAEHVQKIEAAGQFVMPD